MARAVGLTDSGKLKPNSESIDSNAARLKQLNLMSILKKLTVGALALAGLSLATPAQADWHHHYYSHHHYYYGHPRVYYYGYSRPYYYSPYYYDDYSYPYYYGGPSYNFSFGFGGHRGGWGGGHWHGGGGHSHGHHH